MMQLSRTVETVLKTLVTAAALWAAAVTFAAAEVIQNFAVDISVEDTSDLLITENITYDFEGASRHGIFREVLSAHAQPATTWYKNRLVILEPISVTRDGAPEQFVDEGGGGNMYLRIGDTDVTISGVHTYVIVYRVKGALSVYDSGLAEVYWNVTGTGWQVPIKQVEVAVYPTGSVQFGEEAACYVGEVGSIVSCDSISKAGTSTLFTQDNLLPGNGLTIAQVVSHPSWQVPSSAGIPPELTEQTVSVIVERINWLPFVLGGFILAIFGLLIKLLRWKFHYRTNPTIIAQYEPYQDFKPMFTGVLIDNRLDSRDITAGIVHLAQQGFISIKQTEEKVLGLFNIHDYEVTLKRPFDEASTHFEQDLLALLFEGQVDVKTNNEPFFAKLLTLTNQTAAPSFQVGKTVSLSDIKFNQSKKRLNYRLIQTLKLAAHTDLRTLGFLEQSLFFTRRTEKGYEALNYLKGFKDFLSVTEAERYKFHNAPSKSPEQFMEYLPYAIAFGVEKEWAEVFSDISIANPDWYSSSVPGAHFSAVSFASELSAFSGSLASSGSSSTASSGGGSSGGGSGGGGGGSW